MKLEMMAGEDVELRVRLACMFDTAWRGTRDRGPGPDGGAGLGSRSSTASSRRITSR
jgi:hypothetical protein